MAGLDAGITWLGAHGYVQTLETIASGYLVASAGPPAARGTA